MMILMMMIVSDLVYILKMIGPKGTLSDDDDDDNDDDDNDQRYQRYIRYKRYQRFCFSLSIHLE